MRTTLTWTALVILAWAPVLRSAEEKPKRTEAEKKAIAQIRKLGGLVLELAQNDPRLDVGYHLMRKKLTDEHFNALNDLKGSLVHLNLGGKEVTDAQLAHLKDFKGLTRLHLEKTKITDKGLEHLKGLENLEYLNLYGTAVTDKGLKQLEGLKKLKKLYLWQTKVTDAGVTELKKTHPKLYINRGIEVSKPTPPKKDAKKDPKKKPKKGK